MGVIFTVYNYFRNPQEELEKKQAVDQVAIDGKAILLAQQVQWEKELNEKKFKELGERLDGAFTLAQNHTHEAIVGIKELTTVVNALGNQVTRLGTIIDERIPRKEN